MKVNSEDIDYMEAWGMKSETGIVYKYVYFHYKEPKDIGSGFKEKPMWFVRLLYTDKLELYIPVSPLDLNKKDPRKQPGRDSYLFKRKEEDLPSVIMIGIWNNIFKKVAADYFKGCEQMVTKIKSGELRGGSLENFQKVLEAYNTCK